ncbi:MAG: alpha amylase C-terminal domain-containing protein [Candidatus Pacebacteria bacterium]|nr:alpha amylase C-terminal domain-containing protein [Candidatus Paceibacterota bacterium]
MPILVQRDPYLEPYADSIRQRSQHAAQTAARLTGGKRSLADFASGHEYFGFHRRNGHWIFREWAPNATAIYLRGPFSDWTDQEDYALKRISEGGVWERSFPADAFNHGDLYKLGVHWQGGCGERIPTHARRVVQDPVTNIFCAQLWHPSKPYVWGHPDWRRPQCPPLVYEAHVGMAQEEGKVGTFDEFRDRVLPRIVDAGYNTVQLMAIQEHPYYGSFGYHVSNFFAASSRFGTPEQLKSLIDAAHDAGLAVIMDLVHSHAVRNEAEGLSRFDGSRCQFFHEGPRGFHYAWDSCCFNYGKPEVLHFLLSNCRFWLDEYHIDGFRFDGVTSMLYYDHGLERTFTSYSEYFDATVDDEALTYLTLANQVIHDVRPDAVTIAEEMSGMPGVAAPQTHGGAGFDYRLAMGTPDYWIKIIKEKHDEEWDVNELFHELTNRRADEKTIGYTESHDQALVGDQTLIFRLIGKDMYDHMSVFDHTIPVDRGIALHKLIRLVTLATAGHGYLTFMGNEFGHPEWIDFPRKENNWSYHYARRQWHLRDDANLRYRHLAEFDRAMLDVCTAFSLLRTSEIQLLWQHRSDQVLAFRRGSLLFLFNFSPGKSYSDYGIPAAPGKYELVLDTDAARFGGHGRITPNQEFFTQPLQNAGESLSNRFKVYLPTRTALVLRTADRQPE